MPAHQPLICLDECGKQLVAETRHSLRLRDQARKTKMNGSNNLFRGNATGGHIGDVPNQANKARTKETQPSRDEHINGAFALWLTGR